jgi:hypothetical protein
MLPSLFLYGAAAWAYALGLEAPMRWAKDRATA